MNMPGKLSKSRIKIFNKSICIDMIKNYQLYLLILIPVIYVFIFNYIPIYGVQIAFRDFRAIDGILGSPWVGLKYFEKFFKAYQFRRVLFNNIEISIYSLLAGFPMPIILAILLNNTKRPHYKKFIQMTTYAPHFISTVVMVGIIINFLSLRTGIINNIIELFGGQRIMFMSKPSLFSTIYVFSDIWQGAGWGSIIYLAALSSIDPSLHESASIDGANIIKRIVHIDIPGIMPTMVVLLILRAGNIMSVGFEKVLLMQNDMNISRSEVISTFVYKIGIASAMPDIPYAAAIGLFNSVINFVLLIIVNNVAKRVGESSLW